MTQTAREISWQEEPAYREYRRQELVLYERKAREREEAAEQRRVQLRRLWQITVGGLVLAALLLMSAVVLNRGVRIVELGQQNARLESEIHQNEDILEKKNKALVEECDIARIEREALQLFSLRKPVQLQRVKIPMQDVDKTIYYDGTGLFGYASLEGSDGNISALETYMKALRDGE